MDGRFYNRKFEKGLSIIEALVSTAIVAIGFVAIFQMVSYSVQSIDVSNERTKTAYLSGMVAEDLIADRFSDFSGKKLYEYIVDSRPTSGKSWEMTGCNDGSTTSATASNVLDEKINKWDKQFSTQRIKCDRTNPGQKSLKVFDICSNGTECKYEHSDVHDKLYFGKIQVGIKAGTNRTKKKYLYFQMH